MESTSLISTSLSLSGMFSTEVTFKSKSKSLLPSAVVWYLFHLNQLVIFVTVFVSPKKQYFWNVHSKGKTDNKCYFLFLQKQSVRFMLSILQLAAAKNLTEYALSYAILSFSEGDMAISPSWSELTGVKELESASKML